jgi:ABC-type branched-subunit amino acid transport system ATPase component
MILRAEGISKRFGGLQAVNRVSFTAADGRVTSLIGPNGAGKTTIFNCITGVVPPDEGTIWADRRRISGLKAHRVVAAGVARTFQDLRLFLQLSVLDNVLFGRQRVRGEQPLVALFGFGFRRREERQHREVALRVLEYVGLAAKASTQAKNLSYAEQKLLSLARVLATDSALLLLDEPASGLDRHSVQKLNGLIRDLSRAGKTILLVEHNFAIVREVSDHVVFLDHGEVVAEGTPETVVKDARLTEIYFGTFFGGRGRPGVVTEAP